MSFKFSGTMYIIYIYVLNSSCALYYNLLLWVNIELGIATFAALADALHPLLLCIPAIIDTYFSKGSSRRALQSKNNDIYGMGPYYEVGLASAEDIEMGRLGHLSSGSRGGIMRMTTLAVRIDSKHQVEGPAKGAFAHT